MGITSNLGNLLARRSTATWSSFIAKALPVFLLPPFIFARFPPEEAAVWLIFVTLQGMQLLIASSTGQPLVRGYAYALGGATQVREMRNTVHSGQSAPNIALLSRVWGASAIAHMLIGIATLALLSTIGIWSAAPLIAKIGMQELWLALAAFVVGGAIRAYGGQHVSYLMGVDRIPLLRWWEAAFWFVAFVSSLMALFSGGDLLTIALAYQIPLAVSTGWNAWLCRRDQRVRKGFVSSIIVDREILGQLWPSIWRTGVGTSLFIGTTQGSGLYYATFGEANDVATYLFAMSLIRPLGQFAQVPFLTKLPRLAYLQAQGQCAAQRQIAQHSMMLSYALHATMVIAVAVALPVVLEVNGTAPKLPTLLWLLIGLAGFVERLGSMHLQLYATTNHILFHWANGLTALIYTGLTLLMLQLFGIYAFPLAQIIALLVAYLPIGMYNSYKTFKLSVPEFEFKTSLAPLLCLLFVIFISAST